MKLALAAVTLALLPALAEARPVSKAYDMQAGKEEFFRAVLKAVAVDDATVATVELLASQEVMLTAARPGRALVYLVGDARLDVLRLRVRAEGGQAVPAVHASDEQRVAMKKSCPGFKEEGPDDERTVTAAVSSVACRAALRELFLADEYAVGHLSLNFAPEALLDQLEAIRAALKAKGLEKVFDVNYSGVTLILKGRATLAQRVELMKCLYDAVVGPVLFDDQIEDVVVDKPPGEIAPQPDAGAAAPDAGAVKKPGARKGR
jgi:hypothetical protein